MVLHVTLEMLGKVVDSFSQECDLNFRRARVFLVPLGDFEDFGLLFRGHHGLDSFTWVGSSHWSAGQREPAEAACLVVGGSIGESLMAIKPAPEPTPNGA